MSEILGIKTYNLTNFLNYVPHEINKNQIHVRYQYYEDKI